MNLFSTIATIPLIISFNLKQNVVEQIFKYILNQQSITIPGIALVNMELVKRKSAKHERLSNYFNPSITRVESHVEAKKQGCRIYPIRHNPRWEKCQLTVRHLKMNKK